MIFSPPPALLFRLAGVRKILSFTYRLHRRPRRDDQLGSSSIGVARAIIGAACREPENGRGSKLCRRSPCRFGLDAGDVVRMELHLFGLEGVESPRHRLTPLTFARAPSARRSSVHFFRAFGQAAPDSPICRRRKNWRSTLRASAREQSAASRARRSRQDI